MKDLKYYLDKACNTATVRIDPQSLPDKADHKIIELNASVKIEWITFFKKSVRYLKRKQSIP